MEVRRPEYACRGRSRRADSLFLIVIACGVATVTRAQDPLAALGMQRAAASPFEWEVRDAGHPALGPIRFAVLKTPITTAVGGNNIFSNIYVSCERGTRRIAIELTSSKAPDDPGGFKPKTMPRLTCNGVDPARADRMTAEPLHASWTVNEVGDAMARGLWPSQLRQCASIGIDQEVALPKGWARESARIETEITSYTRALDDVFATCGEPSVRAEATTLSTPAGAATASAAATPPAKSAATTPPAKSAEPSPRAKITAPIVAAPTVAADERPWKQARMAANGSTQVLAAPDVDAEVVATLDPGASVRVQFAGGNWWRVKPQDSVSFEGYIRRERIIFK